MNLLPYFGYAVFFTVPEFSSRRFPLILLWEPGRGAVLRQLETINTTLIPHPTSLFPSQQQGRQQPSLRRSSGAVRCPEHEFEFELHVCAVYA